MKKLLLTAFAISMCYGYASYAGVVFLPNSSESVGQRAANDPTDCVSQGYDKTSCANGALAEGCPSEGQHPTHYRVCCPDGYKYTIDQCPDIGLRSTDNCHGYYRCDGQSVDDTCKQQGFTSKLPTPQPGVNYVMPGCPLGTTLKYCYDDTGSYWKCESPQVIMLEPMTLEP